MRGSAAIAAACLLAACAATSTKPTTGTSRPPATAPASRPAAAPAAPTETVSAGFTPAGPGAKTYASAAGDGRKALPADPVRKALLEEVRAAAKRHGVPAPEADVRLDWAMTDLARQVRGDDLPALDVVEFLLGHYGLVEPSPHILLSSAPSQGAIEVGPGARAEIMEMMRTADIGRVGIGVDRAGDTTYVAIALQERRLTLLGTIPRRLPPAGHAAISARLAPGLTHPGIAITAPDGTVREDPPPLRDGVIRGELRCARNGRYQVEIVAAGKVGSTVLANFPVYCGVAPPTVAPRGAGVRVAKVTAEEAERQMLDLINRDRQRAKMPPVALDDQLAAVARAHTRDMVEHDFVGHLSPRTGTAMDRVHRAGLTPTFVSENVGRGYTAEEAEQGFMSSPGHRANIVDPRPRKVGIGIVFGAPVGDTVPLFVTQLFSN